MVGFAAADLDKVSGFAVELIDLMNFTVNIAAEDGPQLFGLRIALVTR